MYNYTKKIIKTTSKGFEKAMDSFGDSMDKMFEKMDDVFDKVGDVMEEATIDATSTTSYQSDGQVTITNNHGHIVIVGKVASLNVNGVALLIKTKTGGNDETKT